uniref:Uncharacterized protein n=1 Tax=Callorhinchus milii TaxID=7868 RepID=A0A4W3GZ50_CALMI
VWSLGQVKGSLESVLQRQEQEERLREDSLAGSPRRSHPDAREREKWERETRETTLELLKVKDRVIEVERNNAGLQVERELLREQVRGLQAQSQATSAHILSLQAQASSLQAQHAQLQVPIADRIDLKILSLVIKSLPALAPPSLPLTPPSARPAPASCTVRPSPPSAPASVAVPSATTPQNSGISPSIPPPHLPPQPSHSPSISPPSPPQPIPP